MIGQSPSIPEPKAGTQSPAEELPQADGGGEETRREIGGRGGLEPTRYGDWEKNGRCVDF
ncbi:DUF1674 domain-containing protein [Pseudoxanthomonas mexicana]|uniref:DUF1674 domain-containing protein n=1 Tax=Pseudoxanthomonas mexicana TaxID=128785 RepID=UPI00398A9648